MAKVTFRVTQIIAVGAIEYATCDFLLVFYCKYVSYLVLLITDYQFFPPEIKKFM